MLAPATRKTGFHFFARRSYAADTNLAEPTLVFHSILSLIAAVQKAPKPPKSGAQARQLSNS